MSYAPVELNGWDYVLAITQEQVNNGLRLLYDGNKLPSSFSRDEHITFPFEMTITLSGNFGKPTIEAIEDGLKLCNLYLPLEDSVMKTQMGNTPIEDSVMKTQMGNTPIPKGAILKITTSLASIEASIQPQAGKVYDVYVDLKNEKAVYNLEIDGMPNDKLAWLETLLKKELQSLTAHSYKVTSFMVNDGSDVDKFIPTMIDFSFVLDKNHPSRSPFLLCCSMDSIGPQVENRLVFSSEILPANLPAILRLGKRYAMNSVLLPLVSSALAKKYPQASMIYDGSAIKLTHSLDMGKPDQKHHAVMERFEIYPDAHKFLLKTSVKVEDITIFDFDTTTGAIGSISLFVKDDHRGFASASHVDDPPKTNSKFELDFWEIILSILTLGIYPLIKFIVQQIVEGQVNDQAGKGLNDQLDDAARTINDQIKFIPALADLAVDGCLYFDDIFLQDNGDIGIGILKRVGSS